MVWRWTTGWMIGGSNPARGWEFFSSPPALAAHPASYPMGIRGSFPEGKAAGACEADHLPPSSAEVKEGVEL